jgi:hypothetical protein
LRFKTGLLGCKDGSEHVDDAELYELCGPGQLRVSI